MSTVKELYDKAFIDCLKAGTVTDTNDNYNNPIVIAEVGQGQCVQEIYQMELKFELNKIRLFQNLAVLLGPDSEIRDKAAHLIWSYILYLKIMNAPAPIINGIDRLYTCVNRCNPVSIELGNLLELIKQYKKYASPDLYAFLNQLSQLKEPQLCN